MSMTPRLACLSLLAAGLPAGVPAQTYPAKAVRLVVPFTPEASNDVLSRAVAFGMSPGLGQQQEISRWRQVARDANLQPD